MLPSLCVQLSTRRVRMFLAWSEVFSLKKPNVFSFWNLWAPWNLDYPGRAISQFHSSSSYYYYFSCLGERCTAVLLWSSRNVLWPTTLQPIYHQHWGEGDSDSIFTFILSELFLWDQFYNKKNIGKINMQCYNSVLIIGNSTLRLAGLSCSVSQYEFKIKDEKIQLYLSILTHAAAGRRVTLNGRYLIHRPTLF